jgi:hypothetical protein
MRLLYNPAGLNPEIGSTEAARETGVANSPGALRPPTGCLHPGYAESLAEYGAARPVELADFGRGASQVIRHDYVLYEYTVYVYKEPVP